MAYLFMRRAALFGVAAIALIAACLPGRGWAQEDAAQVVLIGFAGGLGKITQTNLSFSARDGALMAVEEANQRKIIIGGRQVIFKLLVTDDQSDLNFARVTAKAFIAAGVVGVIGHNSTDTSVATAPIYNEANIPMISPTSTGRQFTQTGYRNVFQLLGHSDITSVYLANISEDILKAKRIAVIDNGSVLGVGLADAYSREIKRDGGTVLFRESISNKTSDFNAVLARVKTEEADVLFFTGTGPQGSAFAQNSQRMGIKAKILLTGGGVNLEFPEAGPHSEGSYLLLHGLPVDSRPGYLQFEKTYRRKYESSLSAYTMFSYDAVGMLVEALRKGNSLNPKTTIETLHSMQYKGISGPISFGVDGSQNNPPYSLYKVVQRKWVLVRTYGN